MPRSCLILPVGLFFTGVSIPVLMVLQILQPTLLMGFTGFILTLTGGMLLLTRCSEI